tara:strand:+ start:867 stop:1451 length:585 start_codon:yes stop_codon:yes gene_type:complete
MKHLLIIIIFFLAACAPSKSDASPEEVSSEETSSDLIPLDEFLLKKHAIAAWVMDDNFIPPSDDWANGSAETVYIKVLKQCAANFSIMYANMQAGLSFGKTITGLEDPKEMERLSKEYKNHSLYFAVRTEELLLKDRKDIDALRDSIDNELISIQNEIFEIVSDEIFVDLLESNAEICLLVRDQNPDNKSYKFE